MAGDLPHAISNALASAEALDGPAEAISAKVRDILPPGVVKDLLSGTWLGHPLHPVLTDVPIGTWTSATILDLVGGEDAAGAAEKLIGIGIAAALPTAVSGYSDWADTTLMSNAVKRIGIVHAVANVTALGLYTASLLARRSGRRGRGIALGLAGGGALAVGGFLGGDLSYTRGVGVDQTAFDAPPEDWTDALADADLAAGTLAVATTGGVDVLVARGDDGRLHAMADRCAHRGGPLHEGRLVDGCVECPWHASRFRLEDGSIECGPTTFPQPPFEARVREGRIEVRPAAGAPA